MTDKIDTKNLIATTKEAQTVAQQTGTELADLMADPAYLRQSSSLINDALQKGYDVLQLANGDIVTTGTKTVVYQYEWNDEKSKLVKARVKEDGEKSLKQPKLLVEDD